MSFTHLHVHTEYSLLDGAARINKLMDKCKELGQEAVAITDHGNMYGIIDFSRTAIKAGIKPIIGCELYVAENMHEKRGKTNGDFEHMVLLCKNDIGYKNLIKLDSLAFVEGFYYKPRIDLALLKQHTEGLICTTACLGGHIPQALLRGDMAEAERYLLELKDMFGEDLYVEIQDHGIMEQKQTNPLLVELARKHNVKLIATNDVHYLSKKDSEMHDVLLCIQTGRKKAETNRMRFSTDQFYLKSEQEMRDLFPYAQEAIDNTQEIVDKCEILKFEKQELLPPYTPDNGMTSSEFLRDLTMKGLAKRYKDVTPEIMERAEYELNIIITMGYVEYFLIVWDFINYARVNDIPVGYGRGSGVGSIVAYATGITNVDPLRFKLFFERFLNPERVSMPDFDIDFCYERRQEVIEYVNRKYGKDNVCQIVTFGRLAPKNAIKDTARVYEIPYADVDRITKLIPDNPALKLTLSKLFRKDKDGHIPVPIPELIKIYEEDDMLRPIIDMAIEIEGMPRNTGMHAAGVVICGKVLSDYVPLQRNGENITTQFTMTTVEELGLLKMDFLGLRTLTDLKKATDYVEENYGIKINFDEMPDDDQEVYNLIGSGQTEGVFQLESAGMQKFMQNLKPRSMEDIIAGISLFRPGPMDSIPDYIEGKNNPERVHYANEELKNILDVTYGVIIYQEQVMQIVQRLAGYTLGQADIIRRAMSKKKAYEMEIHRRLFIHGGEEPTKKVQIDGAVKRGLDEETAGKLFDKMETFASYAFNKSHAAAYGTVSYQTAYFMRYYPCEFFCSVLNNRITKLEEITKYTSFAKDKGIAILPPDINESVAYFKATRNKELRFGLSAIKNVGEAAVKEIIKEREKGKFKDLADFFVRCSDKINKKMVESMIKAGVFDSFNKTRATLLGIYAMSLERVVKDKKSRADGQMSMFGDIFEDSGITIEYIEKPEFNNLEKLELEKEVLGIYVSGHPLDEYKDLLDDLPMNTSKLLPLGSSDEKEEDEMEIATAIVNEGELGQEIEPSQPKRFERQKVTMGGMLKDLNQVMTKTQQVMKYGKLEDLFGNIEVVFFPKVYAKYSKYIDNGQVVKITGDLTIKNGSNYQLSAEYVKPLNNVVSQPQAVEVNAKPKRLYMLIESKSVLDQVRSIIDYYNGDTQVVVKYMGKPFILDETISVDDDLIEELLSVLDKNCIIYK